MVKAMKEKILKLMKDIHEAKELMEINDLLGLTTEEIYQKYGYMGNNVISHSITFPNGIEAHVNLSIIDEKGWFPITDITLFKEGKELTHNTSEDSHYKGTWWIEYEGIEYEVNVIEEE